MKNKVWTLLLLMLFSSTTLATEMEVQFYGLGSFPQIKYSASVLSEPNLTNIAVEFNGDISTLIDQAYSLWAAEKTARINGTIAFDHKQTPYLKVYEIIDCEGALSGG